MELRLWKTVKSFCSPSRNIAPHISLHDLPYHEEMSAPSFPEQSSFSLLLQRSWIQTYFCNFPHYLRLIRILVEYTTNNHGQGMMLARPTRLLSKYFSHWVNVLFLPSQSFHVHIYRQELSFPNLELFPNRVPIELSRFAFPIIVLPEDDRTDSFQVERLGLPYWTMIWAICVVVDESKCLDIPIWEFSVILEHLPFFIWVEADTASAACSVHLGSLDMT